MENGNKFKIVAQNVSDDNYYIQSAVFNGRPFDRAWLSHTEITDGGELVFEMGPKPNKTWATGKEYLPPDLMTE